MFNTIFSKTCELCGESFETRLPRQKYCSKKCRMTMADVERKKKKVYKAGPGTVCLYCGKIIGLDRVNNTTYCSDECVYKARKQRDRNRIRAQNPIGARNCEYCGAPFMPKHKHQKYCSGDCSNRVHYERARLKREQELSTPKIKKCGWCGKDFESYHSRKKYCSEECAYEANKANGRHQYDDYHARYMELPKEHRPKKTVHKKPGQYETIQATINQLRADGVRYADYQREKTLAMIPPINLNIGG